MKKVLSYLIPAVLLIVVLGWLFEDFLLTSGYAPSAYPRYSPRGISETQVVLIKNADKSGEALLFKVGEDPQFFSYDPMGKIINKVGSRGWDASKEKELDCWEQSTPDDYSGPIYGNYLLDARKSPDNTKIAVLSAYGPKYKSLSFGPVYPGAEVIRGSRYLEIRNVATNEPVRKPAKIDISYWVRQPKICWSDGARYVVVYNDDVNLTADFSVVDVPSI